MNTGAHEAAFTHALETLRRRFCGGYGVQGQERDGPAQYAWFLYADETGMDEARSRARLFASGLVTRFLELVDRRKEALMMA
ncbi:MAG: hypothetical protein EOO82_02630 [Oxalobacteraceae bacterium]|nr:MAG: hypothetical protein EOO82_02630 [Oxalobacteraceae bacterium]